MAADDSFFGYLSSEDDENEFGDDEGGPPRRHMKLESLSVEALRAILGCYVADVKSLEQIEDKEVLINLISRHLPESTRLPVDLDLAEDNIRFLRKIDNGCYGDVWEGSYGVDDRCAIKILSVREGHAPNGTAIGEIIKEMDILRECCRHRNLIQYYGAACRPPEPDRIPAEPSRIAILMELADCDLGSYLRSSDGLKIRFWERVDILQQLARGLRHLHKHKIVHLDLKLKNVLKVGDVFKLTDFGVSAVRSGVDDELRPEAFRKLPGNLAHMAPEIMKGEAFGAPADIFSFGILCWEVLKGKEWADATIEKHFQKRNLQDMFSSESSRRIYYQEQVMGGFRPIMPKKWHPAIALFLNTLWHPDPSQRPNATQLCVSLTRLRTILRIANLEEWLSIDPRAFHFWIDKFDVDIRNYLKGDHILSKSDDRVPWRTFLKELANLEPNLRSKIREWEPRLQLAFDIPPPGREDSMVTLERFGQVVAAFGPFWDDSGIRNFLFRIRSTMVAPGFHPLLSTIHQTEAYLRGQKHGTFIVRFSTKPRYAFTIARVDASHHGPCLLQWRIWRPDPRSPLLGIHSTRGRPSRTYTDLPLLINELSEKLHLLNYVVFNITPGALLDIAPLDIGDPYGLTRPLPYHPTEAPPRLEDDNT